MMVNFSPIIIIMSRYLLMRKSRVLLDEPFACEPLGLKLCINRQLLRQPNAFRWSEHCHRWEAAADARFEHFTECPLELQLFLLRGNHLQVICEGTVSPAILQRHLNQEVKVLLSYDGLVTGWLYCYFSAEGEAEEPGNDKFFSMQKINLAFLEEIEEQITIKIKQNQEQIFEKAFRLNQRSKTLFPNLKKTVRLSDVFRVEVSVAGVAIRPVIFLVDHIKRGKNTTFEAWLRNSHKNRVGNMHMEYYMENLFLQNERHLRTRKAIHPDSLEYAKTIAAKKINERHQLELQQQMGISNSIFVKRRIEEADQRISIINNNVNLMLLEIKNNETPGPSIKKSKTTFSYRNLQSKKEKLTFYFQGEKQ